MTLIERLTTAERGSRELDLAIIAECGVPGWPSYTTSMDCAFGLAERVLPSSPAPADVPWDEWQIDLTRSPVWRRETRVTWDCAISNGLGFGVFVKSLATPALALCAAILTAQSHKEKTNGE